MMLPFSSSLDVSYTGQHSYHTEQTVNLNTIDYGAAYLPELQDPTQTFNGVDVVAREHQHQRGTLIHGLRQHHSEPAERAAHVSLDPVVLEPAAQQRDLLRVQRHDEPV
jgi:hypothetical protein